MKPLNMTIRMGAAAWTATDAYGRVTDFRKMKGDDRRRWYGRFMSDVRRALRGDGGTKAKRGGAR